MDEHEYQKKMMLVRAQQQYKAIYQRVQSAWGSYNEAQKFQAYQQLNQLRAQIDHIARS